MKLLKYIYHICCRLLYIVLCKSVCVFRVNGRFEALKTEQSQRQLDLFRKPEISAATEATERVTGIYQHF